MPLDKCIVSEIMKKRPWSEVLKRLVRYPNAQSLAAGYEAVCLVIVRLHRTRLCDISWP